MILPSKVYAIRPSHHRPQPSAGPARQRARGHRRWSAADAGVRKVEDGFEKGSADPLVDAAMKRFCSADAARWAMTP